MFPVQCSLPVNDPIQEMFTWEKLGVFTWQCSRWMIRLEIFTWSECSSGDVFTCALWFLFLSWDTFPGLQGVERNRAAVSLRLSLSSAFAIDVELGERLKTEMKSSLFGTTNLARLLGCFAAVVGVCRRRRWFSLITYHNKVYLGRNVEYRKWVMMIRGMKMRVKTLFRYENETMERWGLVIIYWKWNKRALWVQDK